MLTDSRPMRMLMKLTVLSATATTQFVVVSRAIGVDSVVINTSDDGALYVCNGCSTVNNGAYLLEAGYIQGIVRFPTAAIVGQVSQAFLTVNPYGLVHF